MGRPPKSAQRDEHLYGMGYVEAFEVMFEDRPPTNYDPFGSFYYESLAPPPYWQCGKNPNSSIERLRSFDDFVEVKLIIASNKDLKTRCEFYFWRAIVVISAAETTRSVFEEREFLQNRKTVQGKIKDARNHLLKAKTILSEPDALPRPKRPNALHIILDSDDSYKNAYDMHYDAISTLSTIDSLVAALEFLSGPYYEMLSYSSEPSWRSRFIEQLGFFWYSSKRKRVPSSQNDFVEFAEKALSALGADIPENGLGSSEVRTAIERVNGVRGKGGQAAWKRFDALERWVELQRRLDVLPGGEPSGQDEAGEGDLDDLEF